METIRFAGRDVPVADLIAQCLEANYNTFGFPDHGEARLVAERLLKVLDDLGCQIGKKPTT